MQLGGPVLSERLASLEVTSLDAAELSQLIADEALRLFGGERAVLWRYRPTLRRLFVEQRTHEIRSVDVDEAAAEDLFRAPPSLSVAREGIWYEIVEASFGVAPEERPGQVLALPLCAGGDPVALLLMESHPEGWDEELGGPGVDGGRERVLESFGAQVVALLANHEALVRSRRHEAQLEALYRTVGEISAKLDLETVLHAITERSRQLVGTPISYITLVDSSSEELFMRATVGTRSAGFEHIRLRIGTGLGGVAAKEVRAIYTSDYLNDARFNHDPAVDAEVRAEGVKSILGVPMSASADFIGVLYVADRSIRVFTDADVEILQSLARHAAVAIDNAVLFERATAALAEVQAVNEVVARQNRLLKRAGETHQRLSEAVLEGKGLEGAVALIAELTSGQIVVLDQRARVLAAAGEPPDDFGQGLATRGLPAAPRDRSIRRALRELSSLSVVVLEPALPTRTRPRLVAPLVARAEVLGTIWVDCDPTEQWEQRALTEEAARVIALELLKERSVAEVERRLGRELLDELLADGSRLPGSLERQALDLGVDLSQPRRLAVARTTGEGLAAALAGVRFCAFVAEHGGRTVGLIDSDDSDVSERLSRLVSGIEAGSEIRIVLSPVCTQIAEYRSQFLACDRALALLGDYLKSPVVDLEKLGVLSLLLRGGEPSEIRSFVASHLQPLIDADERRGTQLLQTLEAYYESGCSPRRSAAALHVHVNTVHYRLDRIKDLLGADLGNPRTALDLQVALLARRFIDQDRLVSRPNTQAKRSDSEHVDSRSARP